MPENKKFRAVATMTTYAEIDIIAESKEEAYEIADNMDGGEFNEIAGVGGWSISVSPCNQKNK